MFRSIYVPLDGSPFAEEAIPLALTLAKGAGASVRFALAHEPAFALAPAGEAFMVPLPDEETVRASELGYLAGTAKRLALPGCRPAYRLLDGAPGPALLRDIAEERPDLVVMATHGRGPFRRLWLGSVADQVVRESEVPVLLVHPRQGQEQPAAPPRLHGLLVAIDFSAASSAILGPVRSLAGLVEGEITLVHVVEALAALNADAVLPYPVAVDGSRVTERSKDARALLERLATELRTDGFTVSTRVEIAGSVALALLQVLRESRYDLLALATHGRSGFRRAMLGSVADKLIRAAEKPILVLRPVDAPA